MVGCSWLERTGSCPYVGSSNARKRLQAMMSEKNVNGFMINTCDAQILEVFPLTLTLPKGRGNF
jgi:hypothetical protein